VGRVGACSRARFLQQGLQVCTVRLVCVEVFWREYHPRQSRRRHTQVGCFERLSPGHVDGLHFATWSLHLDDLTRGSIAACRSRSDFCIFHHLV
jgi:hypothetical protein